MEGLDEPLFRRQYGRLVAALARLFGAQNFSLAEDLAQEAFVRALEVWKLRGVPENPAAWLMATAKNRALDVLRHERRTLRFAPELGRLLETEWTLAPLVDEAFSAEIVRDEELRLMFSCCDPELSEEARVALILNVSCGFGAAEIASALLASRAAIEKRLSRGKRQLAERGRWFDLDGSDFADRLATVQQAVYLLFNEGYHGASTRALVREELCREALRLCAALDEQPRTATPATRALFSLLCLNAARLPARLDSAGDLSALDEQDRDSWDQALLRRGLELFERSAAGTELSAYHLESAIAVEHTRARSVSDTDWAAVVALYDRLLVLAPSPVVELNRAIALAERDGPRAGLRALESVSGVERLSSYPFYPAALAELELRLGEHETARAHFQRALALARNAAERRFLEKRLAGLSLRG